MPQKVFKVAEVFNRETGQFEQQGWAWVPIHADAVAALQRCQGYLRERKHRLTHRHNPGPAILDEILTVSDLLEEINHATRGTMP